MNRYDHVLSVAEFIAKGGQAPAYLSREDYQEAQVEFVKRHTRPDETEAQAFVRLMGDPVVKLLDQAWREAERAQEVERAEVFSKARAEGRELHDRATTRRQGVDEQLRKAAEAIRKPGESPQQAYARALERHPDLYQAYREAGP